MADIFSCWFCKTSLLNRTKAKATKYPFHCSKKCQEAYNKKVDEDLARTQAWSDFMCGERECPKEYHDLAEERGLFESQRVTQVETLEYSREERLQAIRAKRRLKANKRNKKNAVKGFFKGTEGKRKCGNCGEVGHNARTCKK